MNFGERPLPMINFIPLQGYKVKLHPMLNKNNKPDSLQKQLAQIPEVQQFGRSPSKRKTYKYSSEHFQIHKKISGPRNRSAQNIYNPIHQQEYVPFDKVNKQTLPTLTPPPKSRTKSTLQKILDDRNQYAKIYFTELQRMQKQTKEQKNLQKSGIDFQFPEVKVQKWKVKGYLKGEYVLLKGRMGKKELIKKYSYSMVYQKIKRGYAQWVGNKFCFQS